MYQIQKRFDTIVYRGGSIPEPPVYMEGVMNIGTKVQFKKKTKGLHARFKKRFEEHGLTLGEIVGMRKPGICTIRLPDAVRNISYKTGDGYHYADILERYLEEVPS